MPITVAKLPPLLRRAQTHYLKIFVSAKQ